MTTADRVVAAVRSGRFTDAGELARLAAEWVESNPRAVFNRTQWEALSAACRNAATYDHWLREVQRFLYGEKGNEKAPGAVARDRVKQRSWGRAGVADSLVTAVKAAATAGAGGPAERLTAMVDGPERGSLGGRLEDQRRLTRARGFLRYAVMQVTVKGGGGE